MVAHQFASLRLEAQLSSTRLGSNLYARVCLALLPLGRVPLLTVADASLSRVALSLGAWAGSLHY